MNFFNKYLNYYFDIQILKPISDKWCQNIYTQMYLFMRSLNIIVGVDNSWLNFRSYMSKWFSLFIIFPVS